MFLVYNAPFKIIAAHFVLTCFFLQLLQSTNNLPSNSKPPQIKMQSTKKAPLRKEDGTATAGDDAATIAQSAAGPNTTQLVRYTVTQTSVFFLDFLSYCVLALTLLLFSNLSTALCPPAICFPLFCRTTPHILLLFHLTSSFKI